MATLGTPVKNDVAGATLDTSVTCSGSNRFLAVAVWKTTGSALDVLTYNGDDLLAGAIASATITVGNDSLKWYGLVAPDSGTFTLHTSVAGGGGYHGVLALPYSDVHQSTPTSDGIGANGTGSPISLSASSATGKTVIDAFMLRHSGGGSSATVGAGQTTLELYSGTADGGAKSAGGSYEAGASSVTMSWTATNADTWLQAAFSLIDVGAASPSGNLVGGKLGNGILLRGLVG